MSTTMTTPIDPGSSLNPLTDLRAVIRAHWQKYRPRMWAELAAQDRLEAAIDAAARQTEEAIEALMQRGYSLLEAWETVREEWAILPAEEDEAAEDWIDPFFGEEEGGDDEEFDEEEADQ